MAQLKNDYKVMYEKRNITTELERHLRATKTAPASTDPNITYRAEDGAAIDPRMFKFIKEEGGNFYGSISGKPSEATIKFSIYSGNDLLLGDAAEPPTNYYLISAIKDETKENLDVCWNFIGIDPVTTIVRKYVEAGTVQRIYVEPQFFAKWKTTPATCLVNNVAKALTAYQNEYYYIDVTVNADTVVIFNTGETEEVPVI